MVDMIKHVGNWDFFETCASGWGAGDVVRGPMHQRRDNTPALDMQSPAPAHSRGRGLDPDWGPDTSKQLYWLNDVSV